MSLQTVLDRTALIAAGAALAGSTGVYQGAGGIAGVKKAWSRVPEAIDNPMTHVSFPEGGQLANEMGSGLRVVAHSIAMRLFVDKMGPGVVQAINALIPMLETYLTTYESHIKLTDLAGANPVLANGSQRIESYRIGPYLFAGVEWLVLELVMVATEKVTVTPTP